MGKSPAGLRVRRKGGRTMKSRITGRYGPCPGEVLYPHTPVFFPDGVPAGLREQARGDLRRALKLLADCVRKWDADPAADCYFTAAELAAVK